MLFFGHFSFPMLDANWEISWLSLKLMLFFRAHSLWNVGFWDERFWHLTPNHFQEATIFAKKVIEYSHLHKKKVPFCNKNVGIFGLHHRILLVERRRVVYLLAIYQMIIASKADTNCRANKLWCFNSMYVCANVWNWIFLNYSSL